MELLIQELMKFLPAGQLLTIILLVWILFKVNATNGSIIDLNTWRKGHMKEDDDRFKQIADWMNRHENG